MHTHGIPGACVLDVSVQIPAILKDDESVAAVVIHMGVNNTKLWQLETKEGLQERDRDGTQHIACGDNHCIRTSSHVSIRTRKVQ